MFDYKDRKKLIKMFGLHESNEMREIVYTIIIVVVFVMWLFLF